MIIDCALRAKCLSLLQVGNQGGRVECISGSIRHTMVRSLTTRFEYISYARQRYVLDYFSSEAMFTLDQVLHLLYIRSVF